jgi:hypothetical protein
MYCSGKSTLISVAGLLSIAENNFCKNSGLTVIGSNELFKRILLQTQQEVIRKSTFWKAKNCFNQ